MRDIVKMGSKTKGGCSNGTGGGITGAGNGITDPTSLERDGLIDKDSI